MYIYKKKTNRHWQYQKEGWWYRAHRTAGPQESRYQDSWFRTLWEDPYGLQSHTKGHQAQNKRDKSANIKEARVAFLLTAKHLEQPQSLAEGWMSVPSLTQWVNIMRVDGGQETILRTVRMDYKDARCEISHTALSIPTRQRWTTFIFVVQVQVVILLGVLAGSRVTRTLPGHQPRSLCRHLSDSKGVCTDCLSIFRRFLFSYVSVKFFY